MLLQTVKFAAAPFAEMTPRTRRFNTAFTIAFTLTTMIAVAVLIINTSTTIYLRHTGIQTPLRLVHNLQIHKDAKFGPYIACPSDPILARKAGCSFDLLANGWIPAPCFDSQMHHDFVDSTDYGFFEDLNATKRVHQHTIMEGDVSQWPNGLFVTFHEHFAHCQYLLNGSVRAVQPPFTGFLDVFHDKDHLQYCLGVMQEREDPMHIETEVKAFFEAHRCYLSLV